MDGTRYGFALALPMIVTVVIVGDSLLDLWMGARYKEGLILAILAVGHLLPMALNPVVSILVGLNLHGKVGWISLCCAVLGIAFGIFSVGYLGWNLVGAALALAVPNTVGNGIVLIWYACRKLEVPIKIFIKHVFVLPVLSNIPYAICLIIIRILFGGKPYLIIVLSVILAAMVLFPIYWKSMMPNQMKEEIRLYYKKISYAFGI